MEKLAPLILTFVIIVVVLVGGIFLASQTSNRVLAPAEICKLSNYEVVDQCGSYSIANRPCCDQNTDLFDLSGNLLASCSGLKPDTEACVKFQNIFKQIKQNDCVRTVCKR